MKRREFLSVTAGGALAAALPLPSAAFARPVAQAPRNLYIWAVAMARAGNPISVETLRSALKVSSDQADVLINRLVSRGVVSAPNALGVARPKTPVLGRSTLSSSPASNTSSRVAKPDVQKMKDALMEDHEDVKILSEPETNSPETGDEDPLTISNDGSAPQEASDVAHSIE